jgi:hypothetical protein
VDDLLAERLGLLQNLLARLRGQLSHSLLGLGLHLLKGEGIQDHHG